MNTGWLRGSGDAPLVATRQYSFERGVTSAGESRVGISWKQRGSWDDRGAVEYPEQEVFVGRLIASLGVAARTGDPGEWIFADEAGGERVWAALVAGVREPAAALPTAHAQRAVAKDEAGAVAGGLTRRFVDLVEVVLGVSEPLVCVDSRVEYGDYDQCTRLERWRGGAVEVCVDAVGITSGHGVHGETVALVVKAPGMEGRDASGHARIDMRHGGEVSVWVSGVLDAQALADRFVAPMVVAGPADDR